MLRCRDCRLCKLPCFSHQSGDIDESFLGHLLHYAAGSTQSSVAQGTSMPGDPTSVHRSASEQVSLHMQLVPDPATQ